MGLERGDKKTNDCNHLPPSRSLSRSPSSKRTTSAIALTLRTVEDLLASSGALLVAYQRADIRAFVRKCLFCLAHKDAPSTQRWLNLPIGTPLETIAADLFGPLTKTTRGNTHVLVIIDHHTRSVELAAMPCPTTTALT